MKRYAEIKVKQYPGEQVVFLTLGSRIQLRLFIATIKAMMFISRGLVGMFPGAAHATELPDILADGEKQVNQYRGLLSQHGKPARKCRVCGCTQMDCSGCITRTGRPCSWVEKDLCSACETAKDRNSSLMRVPAGADRVA